MPARMKKTEQGKGCSGKPQGNFSGLRGEFRADCVGVSGVLRGEFQRIVLEFRRIAWGSANCMGILENRMGKA